jgi:hypothetical protein
MEPSPFEGWVEGVRSAMSAPPLARRDVRTRHRLDPKWLIGDALLTVPEPERDAVAEAAGLEQGVARSYWRTAAAWPVETRTAACAWTTYRTLTHLPNRTEVIRDGLTLRPAMKIATGRDVDRPSARRVVKKQGVDGLANEIVDHLLSTDGKELVTTLVERLNASKEGRRRSTAKRSAKVIRDLSDEIRKISEEISRRRAQNPPDLQFLDKTSKFLKARVAVEEIGLLYQDPADRSATADEKWRELALRLQEHAARADRIATTILAQVDVIEVEWAEEYEWTAPGLTEGDSEVADAEIVDEK